MNTADFPELQKLAQKVLDTPPQRLAVLPVGVISEALESLQTLERFHRLNAELSQAAIARLLSAWKSSA